MQVLDRLARYVAIRSVSREESALADAVAADLTMAGLRVERSGANVWCALGDRPRPRLLLNSHLDTVPPGDGWSADPWTPRIANGRLTGLGANDAKGCVVAMIECVLELKRRLDEGRPLGGTVVLALTAEEEISGQGLSTIRDRLSGADAPLDAALVGEPTSLTPMIAQRGLLILRCVARGRTGHPANTPPESADNAIVTAADDIGRLRAFDWGAAHPLLGRCHAHVTMIQGGIARNVIPDACEFFVDVRTTPNQLHGPTVERVRAALRSEVHVHSERLAPVETDSNAVIVRAVRAALPTAQPEGSPAMSDMVFLAGIPTVKVGPGASARSHTPDEYVTEAELRAGAEAYGRIARAYFNEMSSMNSGSRAKG